MSDPKILPAGKAVPGRPYKRSVRNIVIHKPMQREFTFVLITLLMISSLAIGFVIHHTIHSAVFGGGFRFGKVSPYEILSDVSYQLIIRVSCILFVNLIVIGMFGLLFLHRVAGPVYRFRQTFLSLNKGQIPSEVNLREGDFFEETASEINLLLRRLRFEQSKKDEIMDKLASLQKAGASPEDIEQIKKALEKEYYEEPRKPKNKKFV